jgi:hypothetical protein
MVSDVIRTGALGRMRVSSPTTAAADRWFAAILGLAGVVYVLVGFGLTFVVDEWVFIADALSPSPDDLVRPFNRHWSLIPHFTYDTLLATVGLRSYVPYLALVVSTHLMAAACVYVLARRRAAGYVAVAAATVFVFLGAGFECTLAAFQIGFTGSVAAGLIAFTVLDDEASDRGRVVAAGLFIVGMTASSPAVLLLVGAIVMCALRRDWRTVLVLIIPVTVYALWYVFVARSYATVSGASILLLPEFILTGLAAAAAGPFGLFSSPFAWIVLPALSIALAVAAISGWRPSSGLVGLLAALGAEFIAIGWLRADVGVTGAASSRYVYFAAPAIIVMTVELLAFASTRLVMTTVVRRLAVAGFAFLVLDVALIGNVRTLLQARANLLADADRARAGIAIMLGPGGERCTNDPPLTTVDEVTIATLPDRAVLVAAVERFGDPRTDVVVPFATRDPSDADLAFARRLLCG